MRNRFLTLIAAAVLALATTSQANAQFRLSIGNRYSSYSTYGTPGYGSFYGPGYSTYGPGFSTYGPGFSTVPSYGYSYAPAYNVLPYGYSQPSYSSANYYTTPYSTGYSYQRYSPYSNRYSYRYGNYPRYGW